MTVHNDTHHKKPVNHNPPATNHATTTSKQKDTAASSKKDTPPKHDPRYDTNFDPQTGHPNSIPQIEHNLRGLTDKALGDMQTYLQERLTEAEQAAKANPNDTAAASVVARVKQRLGLLKHEIAERKAAGHSPAAKVRQLDNTDLQKRTDKVTADIKKTQDQLAKFGPPPYPNKEISKGVAELKTQLAKQKTELSALTNEKKTRDAEVAKGGELKKYEPTKPVTTGELKNLKEELRTGSDGDIKAYVKKLEAQKTKASTGAYRDDQMVKNIDQKLAAAKAEQRLRDGFKHDGKIGKFEQSIHGKEEGQLRAQGEQIAAQLASDSSGELTNPARVAEEKAQLAAINAELKRRGLRPLSQTPPTDPNGAVDPGGQVNPDIGTYTPPADDTGADPATGADPTGAPNPGDPGGITNAEVKSKYESAWQVVYGESFVRYSDELRSQMKDQLASAWAEMKKRGITPDHLPQ